MSGFVSLRERQLRSYPRCRSCGERMHPSLAGAGTHILCSSLAPDVYDRLAGLTTTTSTGGNNVVSLVR